MKCIKRFASGLMYAIQVHHLLRWLNREKIVVLAYHGVVKDQTDCPLWTMIGVHQFEQQLRYLSRFFNVISIAQLTDYLGGKEPLPNNSVVITFDDGYRNNYEVAYPRLSKYNLPATFFITTNFVESQQFLWFDEVSLLLQDYQGNLGLPGLGIQVMVGNDNRPQIIDLLIQKGKVLGPEEREVVLSYLRGLQTEKSLSRKRLAECMKPMTWEQVKELGRSPLITIGAHGADHQVLSRCSPEIALQQIVKSKSALETMVGTPVQFFAYPNGGKADFNDDVKSFVKKSGFRLACSTIRRLVARGADAYEIGRFCVGNDITSFKPLFCLTVSGLTDSCGVLYQRIKQPLSA